MKYIGLMIAIFVAVAAAFLVLKFTGPSNDAPPQQVASRQAPVQISQQAPVQIKTVDVYIAAQEIPIGSVINENMLTTQPWPEHLLVDGFVSGPQEGQKLINMVARANFKSDEPINLNKLVNPEDPNFLAGTLPKGKRLVTIQTDEIAGVAGFIFPGDRVDVIVTHEILQDGITERQMREARDAREFMEEVTETLLYNIRILAVDQRSTAGVDEDKGLIIPRSVSLEVTPADAQKLRLASELGKLSLALRSIEDKETLETVAITRQTDLTQSGNKLAQDAPEPERNEPVQTAVVNSDRPIRIVRGTQVEVVTLE